MYICEIMHVSMILLIYTFIYTPMQQLITLMQTLIKAQMFSFCANAQIDLFYTLYSYLYLFFLFQQRYSYI